MTNPHCLEWRAQYDAHEGSTPPTDHHTADCPTCRAWLEERRTVFTALDTWTVAPAPPTSVEEIARRATATEPVAQPPRRRRLAALAAVAVFGVTLFALSRVEARVDDAGLHLAWGRTPSPRQVTPVDTGTTSRQFEQLRREVLALHTTLQAMDLRHERRVLRLAQAVDDAQSTRQQQWTQRFDRLEEATARDLDAAWRVVRSLTPAATAASTPPR